MTTSLSTWDLQRQEGVLHWNRVSLPALAERYGTPLYVVNERLLSAAYSHFVDSFIGESVLPHVFYSVKTNPVPDVLRVLLECGSGLEVVNEYELRLALDLHVAGDRIVVNGTYKSSDFIEAAVLASVGLINVESLHELTRLAEIASRFGAKANLALRINPELKGHRFNPTISTARSSSPMGFIVDSDEWREAIDLLKKRPELELRGIHLHLGSGISSASPYVEAIDYAYGVWMDLCRNGFRPDIVDLGGGFAIKSCKTLSLFEAVKAIGWQSAPKPPSNKSDTSFIKTIAKAWVRYFDESVQAGGTRAPKLYLEPGRALSATSQALLVRVHRIVERGSGAATAICDAGAMSISPSLWSEYHSVFVASRVHSSEKADYSIIGNMPSQLDVISTRMRLSKLKPDDLLVVMDTGAYFTSFGNTFAGPRPPIVMIERSGPRLIRRKEKYEELFLRDLNWFESNTLESSS